MGNWTMIIEGTGPHHNGPEVEHDAVNMGRAFVVELMRKSHYISNATITTSGRDSLGNSKPDGSGG